MDGLISYGAEFSPDRMYRWELWRRWAIGPMLLVIGLNPSTADETEDDPTVRRCIRYAKQWGFAGLTVMNTFAYRATDPKQLVAHMRQVYREDRGHYLTVTSENFRRLMLLASITVNREGAILAAWGNGAQLFEAGRHVTWGLEGYAPRYRRIPTACLGLTQAGEPKHPLYLPTNARPVRFIGDGGHLVTQTRAFEPVG